MLYLFKGGQTIAGTSYIQYYVDLNSTELYEEGTFKPGPELPEAVYGHCMIRINQSHSILTGGRGGGSTVCMYRYILRLNSSNAFVTIGSSTHV